MNDAMAMVSVCMITYNHEKYIAQAIDGVLMQQTSFPFELIIGEDCSTDNTRKICEEYKAKYPDKIQLLLPDSNLGMKQNFISTLQACTSKYIAVCEGDDYWTDPCKLQKQVDFLEANEGYSMVFTNAMEIFDYETWTKESTPFCILENRDYSDLELFKWVIPTATVLYKNNIDYSFLSTDQFLFCDIPLFLRLHEKGKIRAMNEITANYRRHDNSATNQDIPFEKYLSHLKALNKVFNKKYNIILPRLYAEQYYYQAKATYKKKNLKVIYFSLLSLYYDSTIITPIFQKKIRQLFFSYIQNFVSRMILINKKITRKTKRFFIKRLLSENIKDVIYQDRIPRFSEYSFAQEGEDIIINGICEDYEIIRDGESGFYVDIGAHHPMRFSNTYHFYLKGWHGLNIDAMPGSMLLFKQYRTRDINVEIPISDKEEEMSYYSFEEPAYNTLDTELAQQRVANHQKILEVYKINTRTLESVLDEYLPANTQITFLSIDVEGFDMLVLTSNNWNKYKPKIILVEDDNFSISTPMNSESYRFITQMGYILTAKTRRNLLFYLND